MKTLKLSISVIEASEILKNSLRTISPDAYRALSSTDYYGNVNIGSNETTFTVGMGSTGFATACGKITSIGQHMSEISYSLKGPFLFFLKRNSINSHIIKTFKPYLQV
jgi:hypothetical protein